MSMCSVCDVATASAVGVYRKKMSGQERKSAWEREQEKERMSNELRWVRHLHSLPVFFQREAGGGRGEKEG